MDSIADKIRALREGKGESQEAFGERFDVTQTSVGRWESGEQIPAVRYRAAIADLAGCTEAEFFHTDDLCALTDRYAALQGDHAKLLRRIRDLPTRIMSELSGSGGEFDTGVKAAADLVERLFPLKLE
jgi:transcriptional regulator with XRE-family HTH domain